MPFSASHAGTIKHITPSDVRRGLARGRLAEYAKGFFYEIYPDDESKTNAARNAMTRFIQKEAVWQQETRPIRQMQERHWIEQIRRKQQAEAQAQRALAQRIRTQLYLSLEARGLNKGTPAEAISWAKRARHPHEVAHGWGRATVGTKQ